jgi:hypothetical protein
MIQRANKEIEEVVNQGLVSLTRVDVSSVAKVLCHQGVPRDVITRVFFYPKIHRACFLDTDAPAYRV